MRSFVALTLLAATGCGGGSGGRQAASAPADTMVINSKFNIALEDHLVPLRIFGKPKYSVTPANIAHSPHAKAVACDTIGDAVLTVSNWVSTKRAVVQCRPIRAFMPFGPGMRIELGSGPIPPLRVPNRGLDGRPVTLLAGTAMVRDTNVIQLKDGLIHPVALGRTWIAMNFSGPEESQGVEVVQTMEKAPITLTGGEMRSWKLPHGRYELMLSPLDSTKPSSLALATYNANCARGHAGPQHLHCVTYTEGAVIVSNPRKPGRNSEGTERFYLVRRGW